MVDPPNRSELSAKDVFMRHPQKLGSKPTYIHTVSWSAHDWSCVLPDLQSEATSARCKVGGMLSPLCLTRAVATGMTTSSQQLVEEVVCGVD